MDHIGVYLLPIFVLQGFITRTTPFIHRREGFDTSTAASESILSCFSEYMELEIHGAGPDVFGWLSRALQIQVNPACLECLNLQLSSCGFSLHKDPHKSLVFRVSYTGCFVQQQRGFHVLTMDVVRRVDRFGGTPHSVTMKCPVISPQQYSENIQCDPDYIQVARPLPWAHWDNETQWSLSLRDHVIVAVQDASLIQIDVDLTESHLRVQGRRKDILSPVRIRGEEEEMLFLKLVSGQFAYSMEATCPKARTGTEDETLLHILKRPMGLTKRGSRHGDALTVGDVSVTQTDDFTAHETSEFLTLAIPTAQILQVKPCADSKQLVQPFYRLDVVLTFRETNHKMHWSMENTLPCRVPDSHVTSSGPTASNVLNTGHETAKELLFGPAGQTKGVDRLEAMAAELLLPGSPPAQAEVSSHSVVEMSDSEGGSVSSGFGDETVMSVSSTQNSLLDFLLPVTNIPNDFV